MSALSPTGNESTERYNGIVACSPFSPPTESGFLQMQPLSNEQYSKHEINPNPIIQIPSTLEYNISLPTQHPHHEEHSIDIANYYSNEPVKTISFSNETNLEDGKEPTTLPIVRQRMSRKRLVIGFFTFITLHTIAILIAIGLFLGVYNSDARSDSGTIVNGTSVMMQDLISSSSVPVSSISISTPISVDIRSNYDSSNLFQILWNFLMDKVKV